MDSIKFRLAFNRHQKPPRFGNFDLESDLTNHELVGILPGPSEFELGTPSLARRENTTLVLSNASSKDTVLLRLKWRPQGSSNLVALTSSLELILAAESHQVYKFEHTEIYEPQKSSIWPGFIMQYGSRGAGLKLILTSPYRRMRVVFRGHMHQSNPPQQDGLTKFVKLNMVINSTAGIFDFLRQFNPDVFKTLYKPGTLSIDQTLAALLLHDRHEHPIRAVGGYTIHEMDGTKVTTNIMVWGFYSRQFLPLIEDSSIGDTIRPQVKSKRLLAHMINGQLFHVGNNNHQENGMDFGYTCFEVRMGMVPIDKPLFVNWDTVNEAAEKFELEVSGEGRTLDCHAKRRYSYPSQFFDIEMNDKMGWAWIETTEGHGEDKPEEISKWQQLANEYRKQLEEGKIVGDSCSAKPATIDQKPVLVSIKEPACSLANFVGSKASSLALLDKLTHLSDDGERQQQGCCTVPHAFVLTRFAYETLMRESSQLDEETKKLELLIGDGKLDELREKCEHLQKLIEASALPESILSELKVELKSHYGSEEALEKVAFAVRSSSWGEDEEDMSAAGQLSTVLGARGLEAITKAIMTCFASKYTYANVEYKRQHGLGPNLPMAVVVQEMVDCEKAGVLFTCEPTSGDSSLLTITANYGLGESVVSGQSEPDSIRVRVKTNGELVIEQVQVGSKQVVIDSETLKGNESSNQGDKSKCCLTDDEILKLARCGLSLAHYFRCPRDVEWGYKGGQLYLFQSRPITGLETWTERELMHETDQTSRAEYDFWTRANVGEVLPYAIKPLTLTYTMGMWNVLGAKFLRKLQGSPIVYWPEASNEEVLFQAYHLFFNMRCSMIFRTMDKNLMTRAMEVAFFGHEIGPQPELVDASKGLMMPKNLFQGPRYEFYTLGLKLMPMTVIMREKHRMINIRQAVLNQKYATGYDDNKMMALLKQFRAVYGVCAAGWENHISIIMMTNANNASLSMLLAKYIKDPKQLFTAMSKILGSSPNVISAEIPQRIESMSRIIRARGQEEIDKFLGLSKAEALEYIKQNDELNKEFEIFIERFGHRCYNEFEMCESSWRENPSAIVEMLQQNCKSPKETSGKKIMSMAEIVDSLNLNLTFKDRAMLKHVIGPKCQNLVAARERTKDILIDHTDIIRVASRMLAKEMRKNLRIPDEDLFYYLLYPEIEPLIREPQPTIVVQATRRRNLFKSQFKETWKFDEIIKGPEVVPNHLKPNQELDAAIASAQKLYGTPASSGKAQARISLVLTYKELDKVRAGDILVTHSTDIAFSPIFPLLSGIITEVGGLISHGAVVAREYGLPSVLGIPNVTRILEDGEEIVLDADNGVITRLSK